MTTTTRATNRFCLADQRSFAKRFLWKRPYRTRSDHDCEWV